MSDPGRSDYDHCLQYIASANDPDSLKRIPRNFQPCYADDGAVMATIPRLLQFFDRLKVLGPRYAYFLEKSKSILINNPTDAKRTKELTATHSFNVTTGSRYLGGL